MTSMKMIHTTYTLLGFLLCNSVFSHPPTKQIHDAFSLHPVEINDFYANHPDDGGGKPSEETIEDTINEVQELIESDPRLPRLTRGEIVDIIENITKTDSNPLKTREDGKRALMVVMPFTAGSAQGDDIKELYTRTPVTHMIGGQPVQIKQDQKKSRRRPTIPPLRLPEEEIGNLFRNPISSTTFVPTMLTKVTKYLVTDTTTTSSPVTKVQNNKRAPQKASSLIQTTSTTAPPIQFRPKLPPKVNKSQVKYPNHRYPDELTSTGSKSGIHIINPPQLSPMHYDHQFSAPFTISLNKLQSATEYFTTPPTTTTERNIIDDIPIPESYRHVVKDLNLLINNDDDTHPRPFLEKLTTVKEVPTSPRYHTPSTKIPDISNVAENLSADMKDLLMNFGLLEDPHKKSTVSAPATESIPYQQNAEIKPESYLSFKPLPDSAPSRSEMEEFLARFGLGRSSFRAQKSIAVDKPIKELGKNAEVNMDVIPNGMKHVMQDIGFVTNIEKIQSLNQIGDQPKHVFNPSVQTANQEELQKLSKLLDMIKDLGKLNGNITKENLKNIDVNSLRELIGDFNGHKFVPLNEQDAPNPLDYENVDKKNGMKRQENSTTTSTTTTTPITEMVTERVNGPSLVDLEASFGNQPEMAMEMVTTTTEPATTTPRTGFYYLLDWNSFLELDNQLGRRVNLRFQPHAGNPRQFLPITVP